MSVFRILAAQHLAFTSHMLGTSHALTWRIVLWDQIAHFQTCLPGKSLPSTPRIASVAFFVLGLLQLPSTMQPREAARRSGESMPVLLGPPCFHTSLAVSVEIYQPQADADHGNIFKDPGSMPAPTKADSVRERQPEVSAWPHSWTLSVQLSKVAWPGSLPATSVLKVVGLDAYKLDPDNDSCCRPWQTLLRHCSCNVWAVQQRI